MKYFRLIYAAGLVIFLASGLIYGDWSEIMPWLAWAGLLVVIAEIAAKLTRKKYE